jgi:TolB-like protein
VLAWAYELTPDGILKTADADARPRHPKSGRLFAVVITCAAIAAAGVFLFNRIIDRAAPQSATEPAERSIAVLPFSDLSPTKDQDYFCDGMSEEILDAVAKIEGVRVVARTSSFSFKGKGVDAAEIGRRLGVRHVLDGSLRREGDRVRVWAQLVDARTGFHLWSDTYERELHGIFALQDEITRNIVAALRTKLTGAAQEAVAARRPQNSEAHQLYLRGRYHWNKRDPENFRKGIDFYQRAIEADPEYALAYAGLADAFISLGFHGYGALSPLDAMPKARAAAEKAIALDDSLAEAHVSLATVKHLFDWNVPAAEQEFRRAIELNASYATAHHWYALLLALEGRHDESLRGIRKAQELDPLSLIINMNVGWMVYFARDYDAAIDQCRRTIDMDPRFPHGHWMLGQSYREKKMYAEAIGELQRALDASGGSPRNRATLGHAFAVAGHRAEAEEAIAVLKQEAADRYFPPYFIGVIYFGLGDLDEGFAWLEKALEERSAGLMFLKADPIFDSVREDPRFRSLVERVTAR